MSNTDQEVPPTDDHARRPRPIMTPTKSGVLLDAIMGKDETSGKKQLSIDTMQKTSEQDDGIEQDPNASDEGRDNAGLLSAGAASFIPSAISHPASHFIWLAPSHLPSIAPNI